MWSERPMSSKGGLSFMVIVDMEECVTEMFTYTCKRHAYARTPFEITCGPWFQQKFRVPGPWVPIRTRSRPSS